MGSELGERKKVGEISFATKNIFPVDALAASRREALEALRTAISYRFVQWLNQNRDVFISYKASLGLVWA